MTAAFRLEGGLQHPGCASGMFCFAVQHHLSETRAGGNSSAGRKVWRGWVTHRRSLFGPAEEFPPGVPSTAVSLSAVSWGQWEQQSTALRSADKDLRLLRATFGDLRGRQLIIQPPPFINEGGEPPKSSLTTWINTLNELPEFLDG